MVQTSPAVNLSKEFLDPGKALFSLVNGLDGYHSPGGSRRIGLGPQNLAEAASG